MDGSVFASFIARELVIYENSEFF